MRAIIKTVKRDKESNKKILEGTKMKYTVNSVNTVEMSEVDNKFYMMMDDRVTLVVDMYQLSDEDIEGLKTIEGYDESPEVFERLMKAVVEEVE